MKSLSIIISLLLGIALGAIPAFYITKNLEPVDETTGERFLSYENNALSFYIEYPQMFNNIEEYDDSVTFRIEGDETLGGFGVRVTPTTFSSTEEWIAVQPVGNENAPGIKVIVKVDNVNGSAYFISNYTRVDSDGDRPIYGIVQSGVTVQNGKLYELAWHNQSPVTATPGIIPTYVQVLASIHSLDSSPGSIE